MGIARGNARPKSDASWKGASTAPLYAIEIAARRVTAVALEAASGAPVVAAHASEPLPPGAVVPSLNHPNIPDVETVAEALIRALERVGGRPSRIGLVIPDACARVSMVRFETVPARAHELDELIRWQVRKGAPFRIEEAQLSYVPGVAVGDSGREYIVLIARREVVTEYERVCGRLGIHAGLVDIASFNVINAELAASARSGADWLFVHVTAEDTTLAIIRDGELIFFRNRPAAEGTLEDLVHQTAMYYEDRLGGRGLARVVVAGGGERGSDDVRYSIESRLGIHVEPADPRGAAALRDRIGAAPELLDALAAPVGMLVRDRVRAA